MGNILCIMLISFVLLCPAYSNAALTSSNFTLDGSGTVSGAGNTASPSYTQSNIVIGRFAAFSTYSANSMGSGSYKLIAAPAATIINSDASAPIVTAFTIGTSFTPTVPVTSLTATDNTGVTGYFITESSATPSANIGGWSGSAPTNYTFSAYGSKTLYGWAKDAAGNVSAPRTATVAVLAENGGAVGHNGDINGDGVVDIVDALLALRAGVGLVKLTAAEVLRGDVAPLVNGIVVGDGLIDIEDVMLVLRKTVGLPW